MNKLPMFSTQCFIWLKQVDLIGLCSTTWLVQSCSETLMFLITCVNSLTLQWLVICDLQGNLLHTTVFKKKSQPSWLRLCHLSLNCCFLIASCCRVGLGGWSGVGGLQQRDNFANLWGCCVYPFKKMIPPFPLVFVSLLLPPMNPYSPPAIPYCFRWKWQ